MALLLDSSFVIDLLKERPAATAAAAELDATRSVVLLPTPMIFEVRTGLLGPGSRKQAARFETLAASFPSLGFDAASAHKAAEIRAEMLARGSPKTAIDLMLAGMAIVGGHEILTRDTDYEEVAESFGLRLRSY